MAASQGFEPRCPPSTGGVLPLDELALNVYNIRCIEPKPLSLVQLRIGVIEFILGRYFNGPYAVVLKLLPFLNLTECCFMHN